MFQRSCDEPLVCCPLMASLKPKLGVLVMRRRRRKVITVYKREGWSFTLCYLTFALSVATRSPSVDWTKSSVTTLSLPSLRMQRCTTRRTFCSLRSSAKRWGSVRIGCKASLSRDSLITSLSLYPGRDSRWSRSSVELLILRNHQRTTFSLLESSQISPSTKKRLTCSTGTAATGWKSHPWSASQIWV